MTSMAISSAVASTDTDVSMLSPPFSGPVGPAPAVIRGRGCPPHSRLLATPETFLASLPIRETSTAPERLGFAGLVDTSSVRSRLEHLDELVKQLAAAVRRMVDAEDPHDQVPSRTD